MPILVPLNTFKTLTATPGTTDTLAYTAPTGVSTVVLMAQFVNVGGSAVNVSANIYRSGSNTELVRQLDVPGHDATGFLTGRLVLEEGNRLYVRANTAYSSGTAGTKFILSYLETANA